MTALETLTVEYLKNVQLVVEKKVREDIAALVVGTLKSQSKEPATKDTASKSKQSKKKKGSYTYTFEAKPCPVCSKPNKGRRWRYYCAEHRKDDPKYKAA